MQSPAVKQFQQLVLKYYAEHGRHDLPWRLLQNGWLDPYKVIVSELMLQQTQVTRVIPKFEQFLQQFPDMEALANASLADVLRAWSGLGYNRRAQYLHKLAKEITQKYSKCTPENYERLVALPGIGPNTAGAILAYAYNRPAVFIETNVRTVFIHHFFTDDQKISDRQLLPLVEQALSGQEARTWYWALMDYGTHVKKLHGNASQRSKHYAKQSAFHGSRRQIRGQILRELGRKQQTLKQLQKIITDNRMLSVLNDLKGEALITEQGGTLSLYL